MPNLTKTLFFTLDCKNAPLKSKWWTLALCLAAYAKEISQGPHGGCW